MNIYDAVVKAADHIERNPQLYAYTNIFVPDCGTPGCMLGWVAHFIGHRNTKAAEAVGQFFGMPKVRCWSALGGLVRAEMGAEFVYVSNPSNAAKFLRHYAKKYLAPAKPVQQPPNWQALADKLATSPSLEVA